MSAADIATIEKVNALLNGTAIAPIVVPEPPKPAAKTVKPRMGATIDGRMMPIKAGTITENQRRRISDWHAGHGDLLVKNFSTWHAFYRADQTAPKSLKALSMRDASDFYAWLKASRAKNAR